MKLQAQRASGLEPASAYPEWKSRERDALLTAIKQQFPDASAGLPPLADLLATADSAYRSATTALTVDSGAVPQIIQSTVVEAPHNKPASASLTATSSPIKQTSVTTVLPLARPAVPNTAPSTLSTTTTTTTTTGGVGAGVGSSSVGVGEEVDTISDNMSHLSMMEMLAAVQTQLSPRPVLFHQSPRPR